MQTPVGFEIAIAVVGLDAGHYNNNNADTVEAPLEAPLEPKLDFTKTSRFRKCLKENILGFKFFISNTSTSGSTPLHRKNGFSNSIFHLLPRYKYDKIW